MKVPDTIDVPPASPEPPRHRRQSSIEYAGPSSGFSTFGDDDYTMYLPPAMPGTLDAVPAPAPAPPAHRRTRSSDSTSSSNKKKKRSSKSKKSGGGGGGGGGTASMDTMDFFGMPEVE